MKSVPPEIVSTIFRHVQTSGKNLDAIRRVLPLSQVCRLWRKTAINDACLWTAIPAHHSLWAAELLQRSKGCNLDVCLTEGVTRRTYTSILPHIRRFRKLVVRMQMGELVDTLLNLPNEKTKALVHLDIGYSSTTVDKNNQMVIPNDLFSGAALHHLSLSGVGIRLTSHLFNRTTLKHLSLRHLPSQSKLSWMSTRALLKDLVNLESLTLVSSLKRLYNPDAQNVAIHMASLKNLVVFTDTVQHLVAFFKMITYPRISELSVGAGVRSTDEDPTIDEALRHILDACTAGDPSEDINVLRMHASQYESENRLLRLAPDRRAFYGISTGDHPFRMLVDIADRGGAASGIEVSEKVFRTLNLSNLRRLVGRGTLNENCIRFLARLPFLKHMSVYGTPMARIFSQVACEDLHNNFPAMTSLEVRNRSSMRHTSSDAAMFHLLCAFLSQRKQAGNALNTLRLVGFRKMDNDTLCDFRDTAERALPAPRS